MMQLRPYQQDVLNTLKGKLKETDYPLLVNASVGAGKSLIIAELLRVIERAGWRALCLTMNSTLIRQNAETYAKQGGSAGIFCASLGQKDTGESIIFASPMSVRGSIKRDGKLSKIPFNLIIVDECHNINVLDRGTSYMRIFNHYSIYAQAKGHKVRFVGLTGTPYRGKGHTIIGENQFFKEEVCSISAEWLIAENYLTPPIWGYCDKTLQYDFQKLKINGMGKFNSVELDEAVHKQPRLTGKIMAEVTEIVKSRKGAFIFASSVKHCHECAEWLPKGETAIITGDTPDKVREQYIKQARAGIIKYLVNVNVLCTGVDVPTFDTVVFVRPTESLVLYMQCLGRGLRLADGKTNCLILDYAGNLDRHGDIDNPIINEALKPKSDDDPDYCIECFDCNSMNTLMARRCIGIVEDKKRCDHYFEWKDCPGCGAKNDIVARQCRECRIELIDPNSKLNDIASNKTRITIKVKETRYSLSNINGFPRFDITYIPVFDDFVSDYKAVIENYLLSTDKAIRFFYHTIVKQHFIHPHQAYDRLQNIQFLKSVIENGELYSPKKIECIEMDGRLKVVDKYFEHPIIDKNLRQLDVLYTFYEFNRIKKFVTFEYLVFENDEFKLFRDNYRINNPQAYKRFAKNYGSAIGNDIDTIAFNQFVIQTPTKIWVDDSNRMQKFVEDSQTLAGDERREFFIPRQELSAIFDKWCDPVKIEVFNNQVAYTKEGKSFKVYRAAIYATVYHNGNLRLIQVSCKIAESDLDKLQSKEYRCFKVKADTAHGEDINKWRTLEGTEFDKTDCVDWEQ